MIHPAVSYPISADVPTSPLPYSPCVSVGDLIFVSGQASVDSAGTIVSDTFEGEFRRALANLAKVLAAAGSDLAHVVQIPQLRPRPRRSAALQRAVSRVLPAALPRAHHHHELPAHDAALRNRSRRRPCYPHASSLLKSRCNESSDFRLPSRHRDERARVQSRSTLDARKNPPRRDRGAGYRAGWRSRTHPQYRVPAGNAAGTNRHLRGHPDRALHAALWQAPRLEQPGAGVGADAGAARLLPRDGRLRAK